MAVSGLGNSGDPAQLQTLSDFIQNDPAPDVRIAAVRGVSNIRDFSIFDHLYPALNDPEESVRKAALGAIEDRIGLKFPEYNPDGSASARAAAITRIRATVSRMKTVFDRDTDQQNHQNPNRK
jgi:HEAT repeat protein